MAKFTIKDLAEGRCAVKNDGTVEELNKVLKAAFPVKNQPAIGSSDIYFKINGGFWTGGCDTKFPVQIGEAFIESSSLIHTWDHEDAYKRVDSIDRNLCSSREEAEAFLVLMQLGKAWVGSWEQPDHNTIISAITYYISDGRVIIMTLE